MVQIYTVQINSDHTQTKNTGWARSITRSGPGHPRRHTPMLLDCTYRLKCACSPATRTCGTCRRRTSGKPPGHPNPTGATKRAQPEYRSAVSQACYWGFYKIWSTRPSPRPNLRGRNCPLSAMGVKVSLVCSNSTVFLRMDISSQYVK